MHRSWGVALLVALVSCAGTDTGNPARNIAISECKSEHPTQASAAVVQGLRAESYDGLACFEWQRTDAVIRFDAYNFMGGCAVEWSGEAHARAADGLEFVVRNPSCAVAGCGSCLYDASFEIDTGSSRLRADAKIPLLAQDCEGKGEALGSWQLQGAAEDHGVVCDYARGLVWHAGRLGTCGQRHMPCRSACNDRDHDDCDAGLACTEVSEYDRVCLQTCKSDADCPLAGLMRCDGAVCRLGG